jgi:hypothetical protein
VLEAFPCRIADRDQEENINEIHGGKLRIPWPGNDHIRK